MSSFRQYHWSSSGNKKKTKRKTKLTVFVYGCDDEVDQFDRPNKERKENFFSSLIESMMYINSNQYTCTIV